MKKFLQGVDALTKAMMIFTAFCAFGIALLILIEVFARNTGLHFYGAAEYVRNFLIVIVFLQLPFAVRVRGMLVVDIFVGSLPKRAAVPVSILGDLLGLLFFGAVAAGSLDPAIQAWVEGEYEGEGVVDVPAWPAKLSIVIGCGIAAFYYYVRIVETFKSGEIAARSRGTPQVPSFGRLRLNRIGRPEVERWFDAYSRTAPGGANNALQLLGQIMNSAVAAGHTDTNPTRGIRKNPRRKLTRFLSGEEIDRLHRTLDRLVEERPSRRGQADIIRLLLLTGCRRGEILRLKWSEVDGPVLRLAETKTGPRQVWLSEAAQAIIAHQPRTGSAYVFPSPKCPARPCSSAMGLWYRARKEAGIDDVRLHDLRHTVASQAVARGVALSTVARMLGHSDPTMTLRYAHVSDREVEAAAERIGEVIERAMATGK